MTEAAPTYGQHYQAIGRMIVAFQGLEATLKAELTLLMNNELGTVSGQLVYAMVAEASFGTAVRIASALPSVFTPARLGVTKEESVAQLSRCLLETSEQLKKGLRLATEVEERRNQLVHSHWFESSGYVAPEGMMSRMKTKTRKGGVSTAFEHESIEAIAAVAGQARTAQELVGAALRDYKQIMAFEW
jgi:hypothetical protein